MASRQLAAVARSAEDYLQVYSTVLAQASRPVILHWLGEMFDPQLQRLLGVDRHPDRHPHLPRFDPRAQRQGRRGEGLAALR